MRKGQAARMRWCRTIRGIIPFLVGLFVVAQLSGVVPSRLVHGLPSVNAAMMIIHDHHAHAPMDQGKTTHHHDNSAADECCALHILIAVLAPVLASTSISLAGERVSTERQDFVAGLLPRRLDRPPISL
jgi:hypothetical protein